MPIYSYVSLDQNLACPQRLVAESVRSRAARRLEAVRVSLCAHLEVAEELLPLDNLAAFYNKHEKHVQLALTYPEARVFKDAVPRVAVLAYEKTCWPDTA